MLSINLIQLIASYLDYEPQALAILSKLSHKHRSKVHSNQVCTGYYVSRPTDFKGCPVCLQANGPSVSISIGDRHLHYNVELHDYCFATIHQIHQALAIPQLSDFTMRNNRTDRLIWVSNRLVDGVLRTDIISANRELKDQYKRSVAQQNGEFLSVTYKCDQWIHDYSYAAGKLTNVTELKRTGVRIESEVKHKLMNSESSLNYNDCNDFKSKTYDAQRQVTQEQFLIGDDLLIKNRSADGSLKHLKYNSILVKNLQFEVGYEGLSLAQLVVIRGRVGIAKLKAQGDGFILRTNCTSYYQPTGQEIHFDSQKRITKMITHKPERFKTSNASIQVEVSEPETISLTVDRTQIKIRNGIVAEHSAYKGKTNGYELIAEGENRSIAYTVNDNRFLFNKTTRTLTQKTDTYDAAVSFAADGSVQTFSVIDSDCNVSIQMIGGVLTATPIDADQRIKHKASMTADCLRIVDFKNTGKTYFANVLNPYEMHFDVLTNRKPRKGKVAADRLPKKMQVGVKHLLQLTTHLE